MRRPICLVTDSLDRRRGGAENHLADLVESFLRTEHPVRAWVRRPGRCPSPRHLDIETVPAGLGWGPLGEWRLSRRLRRYFAEANGTVFSTLPSPLPEVTHYFAPGGLYRSGFEAERDSFDRGLRHRLYPLGNRLNLQRQQWMAGQEALLARPNRLEVLTLSAAARNQILSLFPLREANVVTIPPGVDLTEFYPGPTAPSRPEGLRLLFVGHNFRLKGLHCLLRALHCARLRGLQAELTVAGGGAIGSFANLASSLGLAHHVHFLGAVSGREAGELYRQSDALVHPTFADHCSLVVLEALASGLPVITTRRNGASERLESGRHGFILEEPRDIEALAGALERLQDRESLDRMRAAATALRPQLDFAEHARKVLAWLSGQ